MGPLFALSGIAFCGILLSRAGRVEALVVGVTVAIALLNWILVRRRSAEAHMKSERPLNSHKVRLQIAQLPVFETARLILREITERDAPAYERHFIDYEVMGTMSHEVPWPYPENAVLEHIRTAVIPNQCIDQWFWGVCLKSAPDELIGAIWLKRKGTPSNRGFWLGKRFWRHGIMTEAVKPVTDYAFDVLGFDKLVLTNAVGNAASRRIKEKIGAVFVRTEPANYVNPRYVEREVWELTKESWKACSENSLWTITGLHHQRRKG